MTVGTVGTVGRWAWVVVVLLGVACSSKTNPTFCDGATPCAAEGTVCDVAVNECVTDPELAACEDGDPSDCPNGAAFCADGRCSGCTSALGCDGTTPICEIGVGQCRACEGPTDCVENTDRPICAADGSCVSCTAEAGCDGTAPVCDEGACRACLRDDECDTLCDEATGRCADVNEVLYFDSAATPGSTTCTREAPCSSFTTLRTAATTATGWALLAPGNYADGGPVWNREQRIVVEAEGAIVGPSDAMLRVEAGTVVVQGGQFYGSLICEHLTGRAALTLEGVEVESTGIALTARNCDLQVERSELRSNATGDEMPTLLVSGGTIGSVGSSRVVGGGVGVLIEEGVLALGDVTIEGASGPAVRNDGDLTITRSRLVDNEFGVTSGHPTVVTAAALVIEASLIAGNTFGGLDISRGSYAISNSIIVENGDGSGFGGFRLRTAANGTFQFNTVINNRSEPLADPPVTCSRRSCGQPPVSCASGQVIAHSYIDSAGFNGLDPIPSGCTLEDSNTTCVPDFIDADEATPLRDYHLGAATTCRGSAAATAALATDYDGEPRPRGVGREIGADEIE